MPLGLAFGRHLVATFLGALQNGSPISGQPAVSAAGCSSAFCWPGPQRRKTASGGRALRSTSDANDHPRAQAPTAPSAPTRAAEVGVLLAARLHSVAVPGFTTGVLSFRTERRGDRQEGALTRRRIAVGGTMLPVVAGRVRRGTGRRRP